MENELIDTILQRMQSYLNYAQTLKLREILNEVLVPVEDSKGFCAVATLEDIVKQDYILTPKDLKEIKK